DQRRRSSSKLAAVHAAVKEVFASSAVVIARLLPRDRCVATNHSSSCVAGSGVGAGAWNAGGGVTSVVGGESFARNVLSCARMRLRIETTRPAVTARLAAIGPSGLAPSQPIAKNATARPPSVTRARPDKPLRVTATWRAAFAKR